MDRTTCLSPGSQVSLPCTVTRPSRRRNARLGESTEKRPICPATIHDPGNPSETADRVADQNLVCDGHIVHFQVALAHRDVQLAAVLDQPPSHDSRAATLRGWRSQNNRAVTDPDICIGCFEDVAFHVHEQGVIGAGVSGSLSSQIPFLTVDHLVSGQGGLTGPPLECQPGRTQPGPDVRTCNRGRAKRSTPSRTLPAPRLAPVPALRGHRFSAASEERLRPEGGRFQELRAERELPRDALGARPTGADDPHRNPQGRTPPNPLLAFRAGQPPAADSHRAIRCS